MLLLLWSFIHVSNACPQKRVNPAEVVDEKEDLSKVKYDVDDYEEGNVDVLPVLGVLSSAKSVATTRVEKRLGTTQYLSNTSIMSGKVVMLL